MNLEIDEEIMKREKATKAPRNSGIDPSSMKMKQCYQGQDRLSDESQWLLPSNRVSDRRLQLEAREQIEDAMRQGDVPPPVPERVANPSIREDRAVQGLPG